MKLSKLLNQSAFLNSPEPGWYEQVGGDQPFNGVSIDSRKIESGQMFISIKGDRVEGHDYIKACYDRDVRLFMVSRDWASDQLSKQSKVLQGATFIIVKDPKVGVANLAVLWRQLLNMTWVAITGSCGKTSVKEMVVSILSTAGSCLSTLGNQNNQLGVPLTLLRSKEEDCFGVAELGADHQGEIKKTVAWVRPKAVLINNVNPAHLDGFGSLEGIAGAKAEIFSTLDAEGVAVLNRDDAFFEFWKERIAAEADQFKRGMPNIITFGEHPESDFRLLNYQAGVPSRANIQIYGQPQTLSLSLLGKHNQLNALAALALTEYFSIPFQQAKMALSKVVPIAGRLRPMALPGVSWVIDDAYNANPGSVEQALKVLQQFSGFKVLVLGDMLELGNIAKQAHESIGRKAALLGLDGLFVIGSDTRYAIDAFNRQISDENIKTSMGAVPSGAHFDTVDALVSHLKHVISNAEKQIMLEESSLEKITILIKGSRSMRMERVYEALDAKAVS